jgi:hypothetical protein
LKWKNDLVYIVYIDINQMQAPMDDIDSVWTSLIKAQKRREKLTLTYGEEHVNVYPYQVSK